MWIAFLHIVGKIYGYYWERISCSTFNYEKIKILLYYVLFNKGPTVCDENNFSSRTQLCCKDIDYVIGFSCYSRLYNILWLWMLHIVGYWMKIGLLCLPSTFLVSLYWDKQQQIEITWRVVDILHDMLLCFWRGIVIFICQISLVSLWANWLSVAGLLQNKVIDFVVIFVTNIIKCTWHEVHLHNNLLNFFCMQQFVFLYSITPTNNNKFHQPFLCSTIILIFFPNQLSTFHP